MSIASYDDLQATVARFAKRGYLTAMVPDFIMLAETSLNRSLDPTSPRTDFSLTPTSPFVTLPSDATKTAKVTRGRTSA